MAPDRETNDRMEASIRAWLGTDPWLTGASLSGAQNGRRHLWCGTPSGDEPLGTRRNGTPYLSAPTDMRWDGPGSGFDLRYIDTHLVVNRYIDRLPAALVTGQPAEAAKLREIIQHGTRHKRKAKTAQASLGDAPPVDAPNLPDDAALAKLNEAYLATVDMPAAGEGHHNVANRLGYWAGQRAGWNARAKDDALAWLRTRGCKSERIDQSFPEGYRDGQSDPVAPPPAKQAKRAAHRPPIEAMADDPEAQAKDDAPGETSDRALSVSYAGQHSTTLCFSERLKKWLSWDQASGWRKTLEAKTRDALAAFLEEQSVGMKERAVRAMQSARKCTAVYGMVKAALTLDDDDDFAEAPGMVGLPDGRVYEFQSASARPQRPDDRIMRSLGVLPDPGIETPAWDAFLADCFHDTGGKAAERYFLRYLGYALTDRCTSEKFVYVKAPPRSGKSTLIKICQYIWGQYQCVGPDKGFVRQGRPEDHPTKYAGLDGFRMILFPDTPKGRFEDYETCKFVSGDTMRTRFMNKDYFDLRPVGKLLFASTHTPQTGGPETGTSRRLVLMRLSKTQKEGEGDEGLIDKLKAEAPGILAKLLAEASLWYTDGLLDPPEEVAEATAAVTEDADILSEWLAVCCEVGPGRWTSTTALFESWCAWCKEKDIEPPKGNQAKGAFRRRIDDGLGARGVRYSPHCGPYKRGMRGFTGIMLRDPNAQAQGRSGKDIDAPPLDGMDDTKQDEAPF